VQTKRLLRESMRGILPEPIRTRWNKQGFLPPQQLWFGDPVFLKAAEEGLLGGEADDIWEATWLQRSLARVRAGETSLAWTLWMPLIGVWWKRHFYTRVAEAREAIR